MNQDESSPFDVLFIRPDPAAAATARANSPSNTAFRHCQPPSQTRSHKFRRERLLWRDSRRCAGSLPKPSGRLSDRCLRSFHTGQYCLILAHSLSCPPSLSAFTGRPVQSLSGAYPHCPLCRHVAQSSISTFPASRWTLFSHQSQSGNCSIMPDSCSLIELTQTLVLGFPLLGLPFFFEVLGQFPR